MFTDELSDKYVLVVEDLKDDIIKKLYRIISHVENGQSIHQLDQFNKDLDMMMLFAVEIRRNN